MYTIQRVVPRKNALGMQIWLWPDVRTNEIKYRQREVNDKAHAQEQTSERMHEQINNQAQTLLSHLHLVLYRSWSSRELLLRIESNEH